MHHRKRRLRRLLILCLALLAASALAGWVYLLSVRHNRATVAALRDRAMASYAAGDYPSAVGLLGQYLTMSHAQDTDATALYAYGQSRVAVPMPRDQHVYEGIQIFEHYLADDPTDQAQRTQARRTLLGLYVRGWYNAEAIRLADEFLAANPHDPAALEAKVRALDAKHDGPAALKVCQSLNRVAPDNLWAQRQAIRLMKQAQGVPDATLTERVARLRADHPQDARFELLTAYACELTSATDQAKQWLRDAAHHAGARADFIPDLVAQLEQNDLFDESGALLRRAAPANPDAAVQRLLVQRLWQDGNAREVVDRTSAIDATAASGDVQRLAYRAMALRELGRPGDADRIVSALAGRPEGDDAARAWAAGLRVRFAVPPPPLARVGALQQAIARDGQNPVLHQMLAEAWAELGEHEPALAELRLVAGLAPSWAAPHALATTLFGSTGRFDYALDTSIAARLRAPDRQDTQAAHALALYRFSLANNYTVNFKPLLDEMRAIRKQWNDTSIIPPMIDLLMRTGSRDEALHELASAVAAKPPVPQDVLLQLADVSDGQGLGKATALRDAARAAYGLTPPIAFAQAMALHAVHQDAAGLQVLVSGNKPGPGQHDRALALARYREAVGDPDALADWEPLGNQYPNDLDVQTAILDAPSRTRDRAFWLQTIERLKSLTGDGAIEWRAERGRWLLAGNMSPQEKDEAVSLLTQVARAASTLPEPHRLLALALARSGDAQRAADEWLAAYKLRPNDPLYGRGVAEALLAAGRHQEAMLYLDRLVQNPALSPDAKCWIATQYAAEGTMNKAITLLKAQPASAQRDALLATYTRELGQSAGNPPRTPATPTSY